MALTNGFDDLIGQDIPRGNDGDLPGYAEPVTRAEIEELLYGDQPPAERLERLSALRGEIARLESPDFGDDDPASLVGEIDDAIARLSVETGRDIDLSGIAADEPLLPDADPTDHRETLAPDSDEMDLVRARDAGDDLGGDEDEAVLDDEDDEDDDEEEDDDLDDEDELDDLDALDADDDDGLDEEDDPEAALTAPLDETEWLDGDGFRPGRGVH